MSIIDLIDDAAFYIRRRLFAGTLYTELADFVSESELEVKVMANWPVCGVILPIRMDKVVGLQKGQLVSTLIGQRYSLALEVKKSWYSSRIRPYLHLIPPIRITPEELESALTSARKNMKENS